MLLGRAPSSGIYKLLVIRLSWQAGRKHDALVGHREQQLTYPTDVLLISVRHGALRCAQSMMICVHSFAGLSMAALTGRMRYGALAQIQQHSRSLAQPAPLLQRSRCVQVRCYSCIVFTSRLIGLPSLQRTP